MRPFMLVTLAGALALPAGVSAQDSGPYLGGAFGQARFTEWCSPGPGITACEDTDTAWKLFGGYRFNRNVAVEAIYANWGTVTGTVNAINASAKQTSMGIAAVGSFDLGPDFSLFGKLGFLMTEQETRATSTTQREETELHYGLGVRYRFGANWAARAEWERTEKLKVQLLSIGAEYRF